MKRYAMILAALVAIMAATTALAADGPPAIATVQRFLEAFNKGDLKAAEATHATEVAIVDEIPPYHWKGREAFKGWLADLTEHDMAHEVTDGSMKLGATIREETSGDAAYVVVATEYGFKEKGTSMRAPAQMTFALKKDKGLWRIVGWTYAGPKATP
jgi:ketosteroid isomerase-like protein